jgi:hypothetical protein
VVDSRIASVWGRLAVSERKVVLEGWEQHGNISSYLRWGQIFLKLFTCYGLEGRGKEDRAVLLDFRVSVRQFLCGSVEDSLEQRGI